MNQLEVITDVRATLGEGPVWDARNNSFYWVDILEKRIYQYVPEHDQVVCHQLDQYVGAIALRQSGGLIAALQHGFYMYDPDSQQLAAIHDPEQEISDNRFNDGKCDPAGRFWAGTMSLTGKQKTSALYRCDTNLEVRCVQDEVSCSNGIAWSKDGTTMYYIDTPTFCVVAYDYEVESGVINNRRVVIETDREDGYPDGMTIDEEGMLWIAFWGGYQVVRWNPLTGEKLQSIPIPAPLVTSCVFGGVLRDELYITTARTGLSDQQLKDYPLAGAVFKMKMDIKGAESYMFLG